MDVRVLVIYGSKYGATAEIARYIGRRLSREGLEVKVEDGTYVGPIDAFEAFVVGSAVYMGSWLKEPADWVRRHASTLSNRPMWLFSSGPLGLQRVDENGKDMRVTAVPKEFAEFEATIKPRGERVFFGALDHRQFGVMHRLIWSLPASRKLLIEGDFRDWEDIDRWAAEIARALAPAVVA